MSTNNTSAEPAVCATRARHQRSATSAAGLDLETVLARIAGLDDEQLRDLVDGLDSDLKDCRGGALDDADMDLITVAAAARIALRRRQSTTGRRRAAERIRQLINTDTFGGTA